MPKRWGWQGAVGVDYRFAASPWHLSADFRYMENGSNSGGSVETAIFSPGLGAGPGPVPGTNSATRKENNWEADFMVGRDLEIGSPAQLKVGLRVADIWGQTTGTARWAFAIITPPSKAGAFSQTSNYQQTNKWIGVGPRAAIDGSVPLQGAWTLDYNGGIAGLFGHNSVNQTVGVVTTGPGIFHLPVRVPDRGQQQQQRLRVQRGRAGRHRLFLHPDRQIESELSGRRLLERAPKLQFRRQSDELKSRL